MFGASVPRCAFTRLEASWRSTVRNRIYRVSFVPQTQWIYGGHGDQSPVLYPDQCFFLEWEENAQSGSSDGTIREISASPSLDRPCEPTAEERAPKENDKPIGKQSDAWFKDGGWEGKRKKGRIREGRWIWSWEDLSTLWWPTARTAVKGRPSITRGVIQRKGCSVT